MSSSQPPTTAQPTPTPTPRQVPQQNAATGTSTYIPVPVPIAPAQQATFGGTVLALLAITLLSLLMRFLWRLPERLADHEWVQNAGGAFAVQNKVLHALGYLSFLIGVATREMLTGLGVAALLMIASNVRPQGHGYDQ